MRTRILQTVVALAAPALIWAFANGPRHGYTTAPGDRPGRGCTTCHNGLALNSGGGSIAVAFPGGLTYVPGQAQAFTITIIDSAAGAYGFQLTARGDNDPANLHPGNFIPGPSQKILCADNTPAPAAGCANNGLEWIEHSEPILTNIFTVHWTAPSSNIGNVHVYVVANAATGEGASSDHIYAADYVLVAPPLPGAAPAVSPSGIVTAANFGQTIQAGSFVTIFGSNFSTAPATWDHSIVTNAFPTTLGGVTVSIDGRPAPLSFVSPTQINLLAPASSAIGPVNLVVSNPHGSSAPTPAQLAKASPAFFTFPINQARYIAAQIAIVGAAVTYEYLASEGSFGSATPSRPAHPGEIVVLYGTGFGPTNPPVDPEGLFQSAAKTIDPVTVTIGGQPAEVRFSGISTAGLYQLNVVVPQVGSGDQPVVATTVDGGSTTQQVYIPVTVP